MKILFSMAAFLLILPLTAMKGEPEAYRLFDVSGKKVSWDKMVKQASQADVILFGELHDNAMVHWLELKLTQALFAADTQLVLGAEMFEADDQLLIDEYFAGQIRGKNFESEAKIWNNYKTDYKPILEFAREHNLRFVGTNIPRRYASYVNYHGLEGLDSLSEEAKKYLPPLPVAYNSTLPAYKGMLDMMKGMESSHVNENLPKAQAVKDATMAHFIIENLRPGYRFLHFNGSYHSDNFESISWYLKQSSPEINIVTISCVEQDTITELDEENSGIADFIIAVPSDMTKTYINSMPGGGS
ncbi:MAG: hypothetical protein Kow00127_04670 [Bacteroidales bacterium]